MYPIPKLLDRLPVKFAYFEVLQQLQRMLGIQQEVVPIYLSFSLPLSQFLLQFLFESILLLK
jgi:hypothetical protein